ncbi:MAG: chromosome segregation protein SMC [Phycisphaerae bacterium]|jgi:chromosome segregation protein
MFLKRVTLTGFKSFSDKVDFEFGPGVTCIVGPNGCGKSNVVDAFKWVLGEQSARSLRGRQMIDMIFNGSSTRRSSSLAHVDLVFDNADRALPLDLEEVTVTRKLYRSGESEYQLNGDTTRLKDIRELFMDTGVGVEAYSVIEQGRVDGLLQHSPTERRVIFEEAAGISKYKARRKEAERKLERTQQNLLRVEDIVDELEKRLRSVKYQAGKARNYMEYEARLNELRSSYAMAEYHRFSQAVDRLTADRNRRTDRVTAHRAKIDQHEADESQLVIRLDRLAEQINEADSDFLQAKSERLAQEERIDAARRRAEEQRGLLERAAERESSDARRLEQAQSELRETVETADALQRETHEWHDKINELSERDRELARELTQAQAILEDEKAGIIDLLRKSAQLHNEVIRLNTHRESLVNQKGRLSQRDAQIAVELETSLEQKAKLQRRVADLDDLIAQETAKLEEKKAEAARVDTVRQRLVDQLAEAKERRSALLSRRELLEDLKQRMEGVGAGAVSLLERSKTEDAPNELRPLVGLVADIFDTDVEHARIIEAALGDTAQHLVFHEARPLLNRPDLLRDLPGRLTVIGLDRLPPVVSERDFSDQPGFVAPAIDLVRFDQTFEYLARHLLGKTIVVDNLHTALSLAETELSGYRFVTTSGEVVEPDGRVSVGPPSTAAGLISRKSELRDIAQQLTDNDERINTVSDQLNRMVAEASHLDGVQQELRSAIYESNTAKVEAKAGLQNIQETVDRLTNEQPLIAQEVTLIEQQINEVLEKSAQGGQSIEAIERENRQREETIATHQDRIDNTVAARRDVQESLTRAKVSAGQLTEKRAATAETINALRRTIRDLETSVASARHDMQQCEARITDARQTISECEEHLSTMGERITRLETQCTTLREQRDAARHESEQLVHAVKQLREQLEKEEADLHECQMSLTEANVRRDELVARVSDELGVDLAERYQQYEYEEQDWEQVENEIADLRAKMDRLGHVNLDAITELEELQERHGFLTTQRDDLTASHRQLEQLIDKLNRESRQRFKTAFDEIRENFRGLFRKLFGGGRADIVLEDPENVLECGIEILAQPPGKDLQALSLMSGGEKSLTAIALLMSIFKSRPAPCAFLDEVDAALDEANNDRFNQIIREFVKETQFVVITHSKWTMNTADQLYGITMQEPGVSTRVSVEFENAHNVA